MNEIWWVYSPERHAWGGLHLAYFSDHGKIVYFTKDNYRLSGPKVWRDIEQREGWVKVRQVIVPTRDEIDSAVDKKLHQIAIEITTEAGFDE